ncbi:MAG: hypothetical protein ACR2HG_02360 [Pyrinomonadaceae bacterium]
MFVENYNESVRNNEITKEYEANNQKHFDFFLCDFGAPKQHLQSRLLSFAVFFLCFLLLLNINFWRVATGLFFQFIFLLHFGSWFLNSYVRYAWLTRDFQKSFAAEIPNEDFSIPFRYLQLSNTLDLIVLAFLLVLIFWQVCILYNFAIEKFQAKIPLR